jgi:hypothetical protein
MHAREASVSVHTSLPRVETLYKSAKCRGGGGGRSRIGGGISGFMGAVVIYAIAKNARGNGGKRAPKTKKGSDTRERNFLRGESEGEERRTVRAHGVSVRFRG